MIHVIDRTNAHLHGDSLRSFSALRYEVFIRRLGWRLPCREPGYEEDQFDDGNATYLIVVNSRGELLGGARLLDTSHRSLLAEVFPQLADGTPPADPKVFEVTRFVIAPQPQASTGNGSVCMELLWGLQAYGTWAGLSHLVSVSYVSLEPILRRAGYRFRRLGGVAEMDGSRIVALEHDVDVAVLERSRSRVAMPCSILTPRQDPRWQQHGRATA